MAAGDPTRDELKAQLDATRRDMQILASMVRDSVTSRAMHTREAAMHSVDELSEEARELLGQARSQGLRMANQATDSIERNPLASIGIAFVIGWLIGALSRR